MSAMSRISHRTRCGRRGSACALAARMSDAQGMGLVAVGLVKKGGCGGSCTASLLGSLPSTGRLIGFCGGFDGSFDGGGSRLSLCIYDAYTQFRSAVSVSRDRCARRGARAVAPGGGARGICWRWARRGGARAQCLRWGRRVPASCQASDAGAGVGTGVGGPGGQVGVVVREAVRMLQ